MSDPYAVHVLNLRPALTYDACDEYSSARVRPGFKALESGVQRGGPQLIATGNLHFRRLSVPVHFLKLIDIYIRYYCCL